MPRSIVIIFRQMIPHCHGHWRFWSFPAAYILQPRMVEPGRRGLMIPRARAMMISPGTVSLLRNGQGPSVRWWKEGGTTSPSSTFQKNERKVDKDRQYSSTFTPVRAVPNFWGGRTPAFDSKREQKTNNHVIMSMDISTNQDPELEGSIRYWDGTWELMHFVYNHHATEIMSSHTRLPHLFHDEETVGARRKPLRFPTLTWKYVNSFQRITHNIHN